MLGPPYVASAHRFYPNEVECVVKISDGDRRRYFSVQGGDLKSALQTNEGKEKLQWRKQGRSIALDIIKGLHFLHSRRVSHLPLWPICCTHSFVVFSCFNKVAWPDGPICAAECRCCTET